MKWLELARRHKGTLLALAAIAFLVVSSGMLASEVLEKETDAIDGAILRAMRDSHGAPIGPAWFERAIFDLSALGSTTIATSAVVAACVFLLLARRRTHALLVAACGAGTAIAITVLKGFVGRARPDIIKALDAPGGYSFPSGHTLTASAIYPLLAFLIASLVSERRLKVFVLLLGLGIAFVVGFSRVYLGVHYPTDVVAGWGLGLAWAIACGLLITWLVPRVTPHDG
jgi:undecaprenyl-diphosphatase